MRFGPGCQRSSPGECAERLGVVGGTPSRPSPLSVADKANLRRQHLSPPPLRVPKPPCCHTPSKQLSGTLHEGPSAMNLREDRRFSPCLFKAGSPLKPVFICREHATKDVHPEGAFFFYGSLNINKSLSNN